MSRWLTKPWLGIWRPYYEKKDRKRAKNGWFKVADRWSIGATNTVRICGNSERKKRSSSMCKTLSRRQSRPLARRCYCMVIDSLTKKKHGFSKNLVLYCIFIAFLSFIIALKSSWRIPRRGTFYEQSSMDEEELRPFKNHQPPPHFQFLRFWSPFFLGAAESFSWRWNILKLD